jgi:hypothetical protein
MFAYNGRPLPAAVMVREGGKAEVIRKRDSYEDLLFNEVCREFQVQVSGFKFAKWLSHPFSARVYYATFKTFEDITAWQRARELTKEIYKLTSNSEFSRDFGLKDQIRRASVSVMSNIAEA